MGESFQALRGRWFACKIFEVVKQCAVREMDLTITVSGGWHVERDY